MSRYLVHCCSILGPVWSKIRCKERQLLSCFHRTVLIPNNVAMKNSVGLVKRYNVYRAFGYTIFRTFRMEQIFVERLEFFLNLLRKSEREWSLTKRLKLYFTHSACWIKPGFHMIVRIVLIVPWPVVSNNVQTIETIIWKRYPDDGKRPGRLSRRRSLG